MRPGLRGHHLQMLLIAAAVLALSFVLHRGSDGETVCVPGLGALPELCLLRSWAGIPCPGCGMTRAFIAMAHWDLGAALALNPMAPALFLLVLLQLPYRAAVLASEGFARAASGSALIEWPGRILIAAMLVSGAYRVFAP